ncbi:ArsR/SmtB family transcription factor [Peribacillus alkalitolerans]|uniref:ArsR/SmtB family transcription factor n=1 Tax=Peribacillus alkalitolerans TaxID=1550385 RepID=UPI0013D41D8A|nr:metalloregulator ArsR/SmtB family transcription factor [Peribacillus alkalitolerans]
MKHQDVCELNCIHEEQVERVQNRLHKEDTANVSSLFKALSDENRLKIAYALTVEEELCVCDVATIIKSTTATASHHLRLLKNLGLAAIRKEGKLVYYSINNEHFKNIIQLAFEHQREVINNE